MDERQQELWDRIEGVRPTMMTTVEQDGTLRARPDVDAGDSFDGSLWFFTADDAPKAEELERNPHVCLAYGKPDDDLFVSVSGRAAVVNDRGKIDELWNKFAEAWFPEGKDDPHLALIRVDVQQAQYWEDRKPKLLQFAEVAAALITRTPPKSGGEKKLDF